MQCTSDTWALDLQWKPGNFDQFDNGIETLIQENLDNTNNFLDITNPATPHGTLGKSFSTGGLSMSKSFGMTSLQKIQGANNKKYLQASASQQFPQRTSIKRDTLMSALSQTNPAKDPAPPAIAGFQSTDPATTVTVDEGVFAGIPMVDETASLHSQDDLEARRRLHLAFYDKTASPHDFLPQYTNQMNNITIPTFSDPQANEVILRLRKERALSDIQLHQERETNQVLNKKIHLLTEELGKTQEEMAQQLEKFESEARELKRLLAESKQREDMLRQLNNESHQLLTLFGVQNFAPFSSNGLPPQN